MKLKILAFGITKDIFGAPEKEFVVHDNLNVKALKDILEKDFPQLVKLKSYFIAVNEEYAEEDQIITDTDEIAVIPPVSGG
ncbi:Sulfur carrier protein moaD [Chryseobacterium nakagawai]|uniref:Molybdopterin synthase sulfur carrier subunit n=1 Tax=Chryseobacterium nakagawai TaxID=1241982 RepID=A0AAD0YRJ3_CHRNA|nr:MoaD/ThiS family protein [Chryseobacterium nakagawai]AZA93655.1 MoaD/ThiS family protein [Chryseobacterium nakagawai]VEH20362.1 Sulfur carrier protein moaD [Chryseobacterium nakagawai]